MNHHRFLAAVTDESRPVIPDRVVIVVAHPDDETLGCGALLPRLSDVLLVHVTDGAPRDGTDSGRFGFASPAEYARARRREVEAVAALAGVPAERLLCLDVPDQTASHRMAAVARRLVPLLDGAALVLTHAYEGGHPDHDATAFAVHAAAALLGPERAPAVVEMPFYRADLSPPHAIVRHSFADQDGVCVLRLTAAERRAKAAMLAAHASQAETLGPFGVADEQFQMAAPTDFTRPPNGGHAVYEGFGWGLAADDLCARARDAAHELGLPS